MRLVRMSEASPQCVEVVHAHVMVDVMHFSA